MVKINRSRVAPIGVQQNVDDLTPARDGVV